MNIQQTILSLISCQTKPYAWHEGVGPMATTSTQWDHIEKGGTILHLQQCGALKLVKLVAGRVGLGDSIPVARSRAAARGIM